MLFQKTLLKALLFLREIPQKAILSFPQIVHDIYLKLLKTTEFIASKQKHKRILLKNYMVFIKQFARLETSKPMK